MQRAFPSLQVPLLLDFLIWRLVQKEELSVRFFSPGTQLGASKLVISLTFILAGKNFLSSPLPAPESLTGRFPLLLALAPLECLVGPLISFVLHALCLLLSLINLNCSPSFQGLIEAGKPEPGQTVVVSAAAGAVGSLVVQIAKIKGCRVVGLAGTQAKLDWLKNELGADAVLNYKDYQTLPKMIEALKGVCPNGIDIYFDNTGGIVTDAVFHLINLRARIIICGQITQYEGALDNPELGPRLLHFILYKVRHTQGLVFTCNSFSLPKTSVLPFKEFLLETIIIEWMKWSRR